MDNTQRNLEKVTLGGGCFWCLEAVYLDVIGVEEVVSGYSGGTASTANYKDVCSGETAHAEVVQLLFDPEIIPFKTLLEIFWHIHDPTTPNRQGADKGPQYRSVIFYHNPEQKQMAEASVREVAEKIWPDPIVTQIQAFEAFYPAENYHQDYYNKVGDRNPYCTIVISPKVNKFRKTFADKLK